MANRENRISLAGKTEQEKNQIINNLSNKSFHEKRIINFSEVFKKRLENYSSIEFKKHKKPDKFTTCKYCSGDMNNFSEKILKLVYLAYVTSQDLCPYGIVFRFYITGKKDCYVSERCKSCAGKQIQKFIKENYIPERINFNLIKDLIK